MGNTAGTSAASQYAMHTGFSVMPSSGTTENHKNTQATKTFNIVSYKLILHARVSDLYFLKFKFQMISHFTKGVICPFLKATEMGI